MTTTDQKKLNPIEKAKAQKHPLLLKQELEHFAQIGWEAMDDFERDHGLCNYRNQKSRPGND